MRVVLLGATGYVGNAVLDRLVERGHDVTAVVRPDSEAASRLSRRASVVAARGEASDPAGLASVIAAASPHAVVHAAAVGDWVLDRQLVEAMAGSLEAHGSGKSGARPLLYTSGVWVLGPNRGEPATEVSALKPIGLVAGREQVEDAVLHHGGVRGVVVRPGVVHGRGGGIPEMMVGWARRDGVGRYVASRDGREICWPMIHVDDLADFIVNAVEDATARGVLHAVTEPSVRVRDLAVAAALAAGVAAGAQAWPFEAAADSLGESFAEALTLSQVVAAPRGTAAGLRQLRPGAVVELRGRSFPIRRGSAPEVTGPQPHGQVTQIAPQELQDELRRRARSLEGVREAWSLVSVPGARAFVLDPALATGPASAFQAGTEFAHLHPRHDGSLHLTLPPELAERVYSTGWGAPHPVSGTPLVYGPRNHEELEVIDGLVRSSYAYARGWTATGTAPRGMQRATA